MRHTVAIGNVISKVHEDLWIEVFHNLACKVSVVGRADLQALEKSFIPVGQWRCCKRVLLRAREKWQRPMKGTSSSKRVMESERDSFQKVT